MAGKVKFGVREWSIHSSISQTGVCIIHLEQLLNMVCRVFDLVGLGQNRRVCISNKFRGDGPATGSGATF